MISELLSLAMSVHGQYLLPFVILLMGILLCTSMIDFIYAAIGAKRARR